MWDFRSLEARILAAGTGTAESILFEALALAEIFKLVGIERSGRAWGLRMGAGQAPHLRFFGLFRSGLCSATAMFGCFRWRVFARCDIFLRSRVRRSCLEVSGRYREAARGNYVTFESPLFFGCRDHLFPGQLYHAGGTYR